MSHGIVLIERDGGEGSQKSGLDLVAVSFQRIVIRGLGRASEICGLRVKRLEKVSTFFLFVLTVVDAFRFQSQRKRDILPGLGMRSEN